MRQFRRPRKAELLIVSAAVLSVVSAVFAVHFWIKRGVCTDMVVCTTIAVLSLAGLLLLFYRMRSVSKTRELSERPPFGHDIRSQETQDRREEDQGKDA